MRMICWGSVGGLLSHNVFAYCMNNPVNSVDPSGCIAIAAVAGATAAVLGGFVGGAIQGIGYSTLAGAAVGGAIGGAVGNFTEQVCADLA